MKWNLRRRKKKVVVTECRAPYALGWTHLELLLDALVLLGFGEAVFLGVWMRHAVAGELGTGLGAALVMLVVLVLYGAACWYCCRHVLQLFFGFLQILLS